MNRRFLWQIAPFLLVIAGILVFLSHGYLRNTAQSSPSPNTYIHNGKVDFLEANSYWTERIRDFGPATAREEFVRAATLLPTAQAHVLAHVYGESLFSEVGASGLEYCDASFLYGCFHQLISNAISTLGISAVQDFTTYCGRKTSKEHFGCFHAIGHGILGYYGYSPANLNTGLEMCRLLNPEVAGKACADGVFMEYNLHELAARDTGDIVTPRPLSADTRYTPCDTIIEVYRKECYFELPNWWVATLGPTLFNMERFEQAGEWCAAIPNTDASQSCFEGLGHIAPPAANLHVRDTLSLCEAASAVARDRLHCLAAAAHRYKVEGAEDASALCKEFGLEDDSLFYCQDFVN
ncbi:MAG: hypothetical protein ACYCZ0_04815 [Minisyncoccota bacterium]